MSETITIRGKWTVETLAQYLRPEGKPPAIGIEQWGLSAFLLAVGLTLVVMALWMRHAEGILGLGICLILGAVGGLQGLRMNLKWITPA